MNSGSAAVSCTITNNDLSVCIVQFHRSCEFKINNTGEKCSAGV